LFGFSTVTESTRKIERLITTVIDDQQLSATASSELDVLLKDLEVVLGLHDAGS